jgi:hypothetical protein
MLEDYFFTGTKNSTWPQSSHTNMAISSPPVKSSPKSPRSAFVEVLAAGEDQPAIAARAARVLDRLGDVVYPLLLLDLFRHAEYRLYAAP